MAHPESTLPSPFSPEYSQPPSGQFSELGPNQSIQFKPEYTWSGMPQIAANIQTASQDNANYLSEQGTGTDSLLLIDMRSVPIEKNGYRLFGKDFVAGNADYLLVDPLHLDFNTGIGYKAIRRGESFDYGRPTESTPQHDKKRRFPYASGATSRSHFNISADAEGVVTVTDLGSANHTSVSTGDYAHETVRNNQEQQRSMKLAVPLGHAALKQVEVIDNYANETNNGRATVLQEKDVAVLKEVAYDPNQPYLTRSLLIEHPEFAAKGGIRIGEFDFMFSGVVTSEEGRKHAIAYVKDAEGTVKPRIFYKSMSEGGWRSMPGVEYYDRRMLYSKGEDLNDGGYVQMTKPVEEISQYLEALEEQGNTAVQLEPILKKFDVEALQLQGVYSFEDETKATRLEAKRGSAMYDVYQPGRGYTMASEQARKQLAKITLPHGFQPDFKTVERSYSSNHSLAGRVKYEVYSAELNGRPIEWHMARGKNEEVWIDKITFKDSGVTSYGTAKQVVLAGALSAKPYEYASGVQNMVQGIDYRSDNSSTYVSLAPYWENIPSIKDYRLATRQR